MLCFILIVCPALGLNSGWTAIFAFCSICGMALCAGYLATRTDTTDPHILARSIPKESIDESTAIRLRGSLPGHVEWCFNCKWYVCRNSFHCRRCDKCSRGLDHHCTFLNNCIAQNNYSMFIALSAAGFVLCAMILALTVAVIVLAFVDEQQVVENMAQFYQSQLNVDILWIKISLFVLAGISLIGSILVGHLLAFHIFLCWRGQLTHEFLMGEQSFARSHESKPKPPQEQIN
jgi:hypothetical protein